MDKINKENTETVIKDKIKILEKYNHQEIEPKWQKYWLDNEIYQWKNDKSKSETFVIDTPPPTVSGMLHMGHIFSYSQADFVARFQRMLGKDVFYPIGFDDNGLPTERLVEKVINKKANIFEQENGHGSFVKKCQEIVVDAEKEFEELFNNIALSVDWRQKYQTISPESQKISQASFVDLFNKGLVERKFEPVFWDIADRTALAQADLVDKEIDGTMNEIEFSIYNHPPLEGESKRDGSLAGSNKEKIIIMTTRPELLPACVAVMVHPDDERYKKFHNKNAISPIFGVKVPIIADDMVQMEKGTGAVMCCTFGDETDIKWWRKYNLKTRMIIREDGKLKSILSSVAGGVIEEISFTDHDSNIKINDLDSEAISERYDFDVILKEECRDLDAFCEKYMDLCRHKTIKQAKEAIIEELKIQKLLTKDQEKITRSVKCGERSGVPIEILTMPQWFVKILDKKNELKNKANQCSWFPEYMKIRLEQWIDGLQWDWCISRQRFFGVKFPVWYSKRKGEEGRILVANVRQLPVDPIIDLPEGYFRDEVDAETDIMDTWATSSISPQISSKGISEEIVFDEPRHKKLFPADLRPQAHEIIRTWAFYTIAKAYLHSLPNKNDPSQQSQIATLPQGEVDKSVPWKNLMISGWCLASDKTKMSKSKGNIITPTNLIKEKGSDVVRYWASTSHLGADTAYSEEVFKIGQKLITKLFNSAKFCSMNFHLLKDNAEICEGFDHWILGKLNQAIENSKKEFLNFEYAKAREIIEEFFWHYFCDNYLEICKVRSYGLNAEKIANKQLNEAEKELIIKKQQSAIKTLQICLNNILKLFAPFIPHICEEIYSVVFEEEFINKKSIHSRGNTALIDKNINIQTNFIELGDKALEIIFEVRKWKSERNLSMKTTINNLIVINNQKICAIEEDLANVCNALNVDYKDDKNNNLIAINN